MRVELTEQCCKVHVQTNAQRYQAENGCCCGKQHRRHTRTAGFNDRFIITQSFLQHQVHELYKENTISHHDTGKRYDANTTHYDRKIVFEDTHAQEHTEDREEYL